MIRTFLDANVLIDGARAVADRSKVVINLLGDTNRRFISTSFLELEVLPKAIHNKQIAEIAFYEAYFAEAERIQIDEILIKMAHKRAVRLGLGAVDAIHLEAAISAGVDEFITAEKPTKPFFQETDIKVSHISQFGSTNSTR